MSIKKMIPKDLKLDDVLDLIGLERKSSGGHFLSALGLFAAGAIVGGAVALLLAPAAGSETRSRIGKKVHEAMERRSDGRTQTGPAA